MHCYCALEASRKSKTLFGQISPSVCKVSFALFSHHHSLLSQNSFVLTPTHQKLVLLSGQKPLTSIRKHPVRIYNKIGWTSRCRVRKGMYWKALRDCSLVCLFWTHPKIRQSGEAVASEVGMAVTGKIMNILIKNHTIIWISSEVISLNDQINSIIYC